VSVPQPDLLLNDRYRLDERVASAAWPTSEPTATMAVDAAALLGV
jgi:hypothetical protein